MYEQAGELPLTSDESDRIRGLRGRYSGSRIFIIGNGPSLNKTDLSLLKGEYTFAANRFYLMYDRIDWVPTFYTAVDWRVVPDNFLEINGIAGSVTFHDKRFQRLLIDKPDVYWYSHHVTDPDARRHAFSMDVSRGVHGAGSVVGSAIQIAYFLGFDPIYLIGCDLEYTVPASVRQEGQDVFGTGTKLFLTSTQNDDASHFDPRYFGAGRRWHDPNVNRMIEGHQRCYLAISAAGGHIYNATVGGKLEVYPRIDYQSLFRRTGATGAAAIVTAYPRDAHMSVDETAVVSRILSARTGSEHVMIDVGAHHGTATDHFYRLGWTVYCFEPDERNRATLTARYGREQRVTIDPRAVDENTSPSMPFYVSDESSGVSGLSAFLPSHRESGEVQVTSIADYVAERGITRIEFLKVDVEGFDLRVLRGVPWSKIAPDVVECEFDDAKTVPLGHSWRDIATYLSDKGYAVYISEWHPVIRYGIRHDWRRLVPYEGADVAAGAWGNVLAFRVDPGYRALSAAFDDELQRGHGPQREPSQVVQSRAQRSDGVREPTVQSATTPPKASAGRPAYAPFGDWLKPRSPRLYRVLQLIRRAAADVWRRRQITILPISLLLLVAALSLLPAMANLRAALWLGVSVSTLALAIAYLAYRTHGIVSSLSANAGAEHRTVSVINSRVLSQERALAHVRQSVSDIQASSERQSQALSLEITETRERISAQLERLSASVEGLASELSQLRAQHREAEEQLRMVVAERRTPAEGLENELSEAAADMTRLRRRLATAERQIGNLRYPNAPSCIVFFGHHKCASRFFRDVFIQVAEMINARVRRFSITNPPFHHSRMDELDLANMDLSELGRDGRDIVVFLNSTRRSLDAIQESTSDWRGLRVLRDPRQVLTSNYFHHRGDHPVRSDWVWDTLVRDQSILRELPEEDGLLYELDSISKEVIETQLLSPFNDARILTMKLEEFAANPELYFRSIAEFLEVPDIAGIDLSRTYANPDSEPWQAHFTPRIRHVFKERYGQALIDLGYEHGLEW